MANAFKLFDPNTGAITFRDCVTGAELTAAQIAAVTPCPTIDIETNEVCIQPNGNTDPANVQSHAKQVCTLKTTYNGDNTIDETTLEDTKLYDASGADVTATHEVTACPVGLMPVGEVCYE